MSIKSTNADGASRGSVTAIPRLNSIEAHSPGKLLVLLFLANLLNVYDRVIPAVIAEPLRRAFDFTDIHIGIVGTVFTVVYAIAGLPLGRMADNGSRTKVIGVGLMAWSAFTGLTGLAVGMWTFTLARIGVGVGEAACAPAGNALISDLYPEERRAWAVGRFMLALPIGTVLGFATVGMLVKLFDSWRAPFFVATVPGLLLGMMFLHIKDSRPDPLIPMQWSGKAMWHSVRVVLRIPAMRWIILAGMGYNFAAYAVATFMVPLIQRVYQSTLSDAALITGAIVGLTGLIALGGGGSWADRARQHRANGRLLLCAVVMLSSGVLTFAALHMSELAWFGGLFGTGWLLAYIYVVCIYPSVQELVAPELRATAMAVFFASFYLGGAAFGSVAVGALSDHLAHLKMVSSGATVISDAHRAAGLQSAMVLVPISLLVGGLASLMASRTFQADVEAARNSR